MVSDVFLPFNIRLGFGVMSAMLSIIAFLPYIIDTLRGRTMPQRAAWLIWSLLSGVVFVSLIFEGATHSLWFSGAQTLGTVTVFVMSIFVGQGQYLRRIDLIALGAAMIGLGLWSMTDNPVYALGISIAVGSLGGVIAAHKAYATPQSETLSTWVLSFLASVFALLSVNPVQFVLMVYPLYLFALYGGICLAVAMGRIAQGNHMERLDSAAQP